MPDYRAYIIGEDGHFTRVEFLTDHADDAAAIEAVQQLVDGHDIGLWDRDRMVGKFPRKRM